VLDISGKVPGVGQVCVLFSLPSSIYIVSLFLHIPTPRKVPIVISSFWVTSLPQNHGFENHVALGTSDSRLSS
jgi:hypothetical protein